MKITMMCLFVFLFFFDQVLYHHYFIIKEDLSWFKDHKIIKKFNVSDED